jgi:hypothetical protein
MTGASDRELLAAFLHDSVARCPVCNYVLRGCTSDRCPECGSALRLNVVSDKPRVSMWWLASVYGAALAAIISVFVLIALFEPLIVAMHNPGLSSSVQAGFAPRTELPNWGAIRIALACAALTGMLLAWLLCVRARFSGWPVWRRALIGVLCWLSPAAVIAIMAWWTGA